MAGQLPRWDTQDRLGPGPRRSTYGGFIYKNTKRTSRQDLSSNQSVALCHQASDQVTQFTLRLKWKRPNHNYKHHHQTMIEMYKYKCTVDDRQQEVLCTFRKHMNSLNRKSQKHSHPIRCVSSLSASHHITAVRKSDEHTWVLSRRDACVIY